MHEDGGQRPELGDQSADRREELIGLLHERLSCRLAHQCALPTARPTASSTRPDKRRTTATLAQTLSILALLTTLFVVPAIPLGLAATVMGIRLRRYYVATGQPSKPADIAIAFGVSAVAMATVLLVYLLINDAFYFSL